MYMIFFYYDSHKQHFQLGKPMIYNAFYDYFIYGVHKPYDVIPE